LRRRTEENSRSSADNRRGRIRAIIFLIVLAFGAAAGYMTGNWLANNRKSAEDLARLDESVGIGKRTGIPGSVTASVSQTRMSVNSGSPVTIKLTLTNKGNEPTVLNKWFDPTPAAFHSNQFPIKVIVRLNGRDVDYRSTLEVMPPHTKNDFITLAPSQSIDVPLMIYPGRTGGGWNMAAPGSYTVEIWYETYLSGKYVGVNAWTGMTNHVVVNVEVQGT